MPFSFQAPCKPGEVLAPLEKRGGQSMGGCLRKAAVVRVYRALYFVLVSAPHKWPHGRALASTSVRELLTPFDAGGFLGNCCFDCPGRLRWVELCLFPASSPPPLQTMAGLPSLELDFFKPILI